MEKLRKDIEKVISETGTPGVKIISEIKSNNHLVQMIAKLRLAGYCSNSDGWDSNRSTAKIAFDTKSSNFIELCTDQKTVTYSTMIKFAEALNRGNKVVLKTDNYLEKQIRKKLVL